MSYRFKMDETVENGLRRIVAEQLDRAFTELRDNSLDRRETIHQVRKRCKKIRAVLRLGRPALGETYKVENTRYRDAAGILSEIRDAGAMLETYDDLCEHFSNEVDGRVYQPIHRWLEERERDLLHGTNEPDRRLNAFEKALIEGWSAIGKWTLATEGFDAVSGGLKKTYARARKAMGAVRVEPTTTRFHEWRKRVKYHWYHVRLLHNLWPATMRARSDEAHRLGQLLGDHHNLAVLGEQLMNGATELCAKETTLLAFNGFIERRMREIESSAWPLGEWLFAEKPKHVVQRFGAYWSTARNEG